MNSGFQGFGNMFGGNGGIQMGNNQGGFPGFDINSFGQAPTTQATTTTTPPQAVLSFEDMFAQMFGGAGSNPFSSFGAPPPQAAPQAPVNVAPAGGNPFGSFGGPPQVWT